jgi:DNA mismatch repair protein MutS
MGSRMLKRWILLPLKELKSIKERHDVVEYYIARKEEAEIITEALRSIGDLERLISKAATGRINPREVYQLKRALDALIDLKKCCSQAELQSICHFGDQINLCSVLNDRISREIEEEAPALIHKGGIIRPGVHKELDELREISGSGKKYLTELQERESEKTGIPSLKIAYNNVFGYYLEVRNTHKDKVPAEWIRKQTLTQAERYITEELKEYEGKILGAEEKIAQLENRLFLDLVNSIKEYVGAIQLNAQVLAQMDCLIGFSEAATRFQYTRPEMNDSLSLDIKAGRHPVIEQHLPIGEEYVSNDLFLDDQQQQIIMITGPNMSGKSALLRQTALIVLMAQSGSFVPAEFANIGLVDKIFTRVGASDNLSGGESTFMVEMNETASILNNLSSRSLILLDEIGRGTSTYDGISIAWSIAEYLHEHPRFRAKTLFATHYHELNEMTNRFDRIKNYNVSVKEVSDKVLFLRKLVPGGSNHSFGIHVASMAGMPKEVVKNAEQVLAQLEKTHSQPALETAGGLAEDDFQLSFVKLDDPALERIREELLKTDINTLTPVEALMKLNEIRKMVGG